MASKNNRVFPEGWQSNAICTFFDVVKGMHIIKYYDGEHHTIQNIDCSGWKFLMYLHCMHTLNNELTVIAGPTPTCSVEEQ